MSALSWLRHSLPIPSLVRLSLVLATAFGVTAATAEDASKDQRQWWVDHYGTVDARTEPLVARAEEIFSRVAAAADKKGNRLPKLVVIGGKGDPYVLTLKDGSIVLTREGLRICYANGTPEIGDSRLAFLIGHELAHLAKDDFWHSNAFDAVSSYADDAEVRRILIGQLEKTGGSLDFVKTQELQADSYGIISMTMAGYDPKIIIGQDNTNFFHYWVSQTAGKLAYTDALHVSPEARAGFIRTELQPIIDALPRFNQGVQLYQAGNYEVASTLFESFMEKYPGREVFNDLGLSRYQLAMKALSECHVGLPAFRLPTALDQETTAQRLRQKNAGKDIAQVQNGSYQLTMQEADRFFEEREKGEHAACSQSEPYRAGLQDAIRYLGESEKKDATYLPARINLSSALIMSGEYAKAISVADEALKIDPNNPQMLSNKAVAEHLFNKKNNPNGTDQTKAAPLPERFWVGLAVDIGNFSTGPSVVWWLSESAGLQASYGLGTFTSYDVRALVRFGKIAGLTPYAGVGYLNVQRVTNVYGVDTRFSGKGAELVAGGVLPVSARFSLLSALTANTIKLDKTVSVGASSAPVTMTYSPLSVTAAIMYVFE